MSADDINGLNASLGAFIYEISKHKQFHRQICNIRRTKFQNLNVCRLVLELALRNLLKPCVKSIMNM